MLEAALGAGRPDAGRPVAIQAAAVRNLVDGRQRLLDLAERERELVSGSWVRRITQSHDGVVAQLIRTMPRQMAGRISPQDPEHAEREPTRWVQKVCLKTLHSSAPWG
jgi:hypothetical protein